MFSRLNRIRSLAFAALVGTAGVGLSIAAFCALEYQYAKHYFAIQYLWYMVSFPWNRLTFAFSAGPESTLLVGTASGVVGAAAWWCMTRLTYPRGVAFSLLGAFATAYFASLTAGAATFSELLVVQTTQALVVIAFFTLVSRRKSASVSDSHDVKTPRGPRFSTRDLLILVGLTSSLLAAARPAMLNHQGRINIWLPILGASTGIVTLLFASSCEARGRLRVALVASFVPLAAAFGYGLASLFPMLPVMWSFYFDSYAGGTFRYFSSAYAVWLPVSGLLSALILGFIGALPRLRTRLGDRPGPPRSLPVASPACEVAGSS